MNLLALFLAFLLTPRPANSMPAFSPQAPAAPQTGDAATSRYLIGPQDLLKITVLDEPELTNDYRVIRWIHHVSLRRPGARGWMGPGDPPGSSELL
jgi:protein involved in polysaccharide export with SLBB domain